MTKRHADHGSPAKGDKKSVWLRAGRTPRDEPQLTQARIVEAAIALLDEQGIEGLTMRRLAERLGSGVTSLYWYVDNKDDVVELALDAIFAKIPTSPTVPQADTWRDEVLGLLLDWRASMLRHPWSAALLQRLALGPNLLDRLEFLHATLVKAGLAGHHPITATWTLYNYVMGATVARISYTLSAADRAMAQQRLANLSDRYPSLSAAHYLLEADWDITFTTGLEYVLNGIAAEKG